MSKEEFLPKNDGTWCDENCRYFKANEGEDGCTSCSLLHEWLNPISGKHLAICLENPRHTERLVMGHKLAAVTRDHLSYVGLGPRRCIDCGEFFSPPPYLICKNFIRCDECAQAFAATPEGQKILEEALGVLNEVEKMAEGAAEGVLNIDWSALTKMSPAERARALFLAHVPEQKPAPEQGEVPKTN